MYLFPGTQIIYTTKTEPEKKIKPRPTFFSRNRETNLQTLKIGRVQIVQRVLHFAW